MEETQMQHALAQRAAAAADLERAAQIAQAAHQAAHDADRAVSLARAALEHVQRKVNELTPVDRSRRVLTDGSPVPDDQAHTTLKANGQQQDYVVLSDEERSRGWVRPYRDSYVHTGRPCCGKTVVLDPEATDDDWLCLKAPGHDGACIGNPIFLHRVNADDNVQLIQQRQRFGGCGSTTTMNRKIAETYARDPKFYSGTFCTTCSSHYPLDQFVWSGTDEQVGS